MDEGQVREFVIVEPEHGGVTVILMVCKAESQPAANARFQEYCVEHDYVPAYPGPVMSLYEACKVPLHKVFVQIMGQSPRKSSDGDGFIS